jgi:hypothetical protein
MYDHLNKIEEARMLDLSRYIGLGEREIGLLLAVVMGLLIAGFVLLIFLSERSATKQKTNQAQPLNTNKDKQDPSESQNIEL